MVDDDDSSIADDFNNLQIRERLAAPVCPWSVATSFSRGGGAGGAASAQEREPAQPLCLVTTQPNPSSALRAPYGRSHVRRPDPH
jgi:hypothetical protein